VSHHQHAYLVAVSHDTVTGEYAGRMKLQLRAWPDPTEAVRLLGALAPGASRTLTWFVRPPAKKYRPADPTQPTQLSLFAA
jgi:hypothetical protein